MVGAAICAARVQPKWSSYGNSQGLFLYGSLSALIEPDECVSHTACVYTG
jgi:hypothetical protein